MRLTATGLGHRFGEQPFLFRGLDLDLRSGRTYAVTGPSGSGKTTLLSILAGWVAPAEGEVDRGEAGTVGWVFQNPHGVHQRSALDHVVLPFLARGATRSDAEARAAVLLDDFGLAHRAETSFSALSGGEAQRLLLARGLAAAPALLLVDEPTAQLDPATSATVNDALGAAAGRDSIVVVATHDVGTRDACTDHIDMARFAVASPS
ncbi:MULTISPECIES: ATP-binding cassette domain-containing protein [Microbacterium]|uniref:ATP-binding cassette domain-containing protein n=1 Tax=Microbacterium TaxID=33882 RepID=UPI001CBAB4E3|nr:ATP-binding cassette domain-containing protein [Microbacterium sp. OVT16B]